MPIALHGNHVFDVGASIGLVSLTADSHGISEVLSAAALPVTPPKMLAAIGPDVYQGDDDVPRNDEELLKDVDAKCICYLAQR